MALSTEQFASELSREIRARRGFGGHPLWQRVEEGAVSRPAPQTFAKQFCLQVYEFPRAVSALHSGDHIVVKHAAAEPVQAGVRRAVDASLARWWQFFDGIERAVDEGTAR
jgi:hypothetical protein